MNYIDIFFIVLVLTMLAAGYARGLLLSVLTLVRAIVVFPLAFFVSGYFNEQIYTNFVHDIALNKIDEAFSSSLNIDEFVNNTRETVASLPFGLSNSVDLSFLDGATSENLAQKMLDNVVEPVALVVIKVLLFIVTALVFFIITGLILYFIKKAQDKKDGSPLKQTNKLLGALFGLFKAFIVSAVICAVFSFMSTSLLSDENSFKQVIDSSFAVEYINKINPLIIWF